ncbi:MAG: substrate-binding domain-containing protein [Treponema sp.]|nr:substrate-binding domain-containing protein [Treponema sp.]
MKKLLFFTIILIGCNLNGPDNISLGDLESSKIEGLTLTIDNFPKIQSSTSTDPLRRIIALKLFGIPYEWAPSHANLLYIEPKLSSTDIERFNTLFGMPDTHGAFVDLISGDADLILTARKSSADERRQAQAAGLSFIETPIALDALVFIVNQFNPVVSLTHRQIQDIYSLRITDWRQLWQEDSSDINWEPLIKPYIRNPNSGSQELFESLVLPGFNSANLPVSWDELIVFTMSGAFDAVLYDWDAISYTVYYYKEYMVTGVNVKSVPVNTIMPNRNTIANRAYPYTAEVYAVIRSDLEETSPAYMLYQWLQTEEGQKVIAESGYVPYY